MVFFNLPSFFFLLYLYLGIVPNTSIPIETATFDDLYQRALAEGGHLVVYAGGDVPDQQDHTKAAFEARFPGITVDIIVDFSKYHGPRIDMQLATNNVVFDVAHLQTLQDFPRWKREGVLLHYKPIGWDKVYTAFKDPEGAFVAFHIFKFSNLINHELLPDNSTWPNEAIDFLRPEFKNKIVLTYPNDDDAILFWFKQIVDKYGWSYVEQLQTQNITLVRSTQYPFEFVTSGRSTVAMLSEGYFNSPPGVPTTFVLPKSDPFITWPQTAAIFKAAQHPAAAKLYLSWLLDAENQNGTWSTRRDMSPPDGWEPIWSYDNTSPTDFAGFMSDREAVERLKAQIGLIFGEVKGRSTTGDLGIYPVTPIPAFRDY